MRKVITMLPGFLFPLFAFTQPVAEIPHKTFGVQFRFTVLPGARIKKLEGNYQLKSRIQTAYDLGFNIQVNESKLWSVMTGLHLNIMKHNLFAFIPPADLGFPPDPNPAPSVEEKELFSRIILPVTVIRRFSFVKNGYWDLRGGLHINYSGFNLDYETETLYFNTNNQQIGSFIANIKSNNEWIPWLTCTAAVSRTLYLKNHNQLGIELNLDISHKHFIQGTYEFNIPNKPITRGSYSVSGTGMGLSLQYSFTGSNKRYIKSTAWRAKLKEHAEIDPSAIIFKGNHIGISYAKLFTCRAELKKEMGNYPVRTSMAKGSSIGLKYLVNYNKTYSLVIAADIIFTGRNMLVQFNRNDFSPPLIKDYDIKGRYARIADFVNGLSVLLEKRKWHSLSKYFFADGGARINLCTGFDSDIYSIYLQRTDNTYVDAGGTDLVPNHDLKPWPSILFNAGHGWILNNNNILQLAFVSNISFTKYVTGTYRIDVPGQVTTGKYSGKGSYIGMGLTYLFTNGNQRIRKMIDKQK